MTKQLVEREALLEDARDSLAKCQCQLELSHIQQSQTTTMFCLNSPSVSNACVTSESRLSELESMRSTIAELEDALYRQVYKLES